jgi:hypothetical protein
MSELKQPSQSLKNAMGALALEVLSRAEDPETGYFFEFTDATIGDLQLGSWRIDIKRTAKP